jgi:hypothetical protein
MSAEAMGTGYFWPEASTEPPAPGEQSDRYDFLQRRTMFLTERLLEQIVERQDADTFQKLVEVLENLLGHTAWALAEPGRKYEPFKSRNPLPGEGED